MLAPNVVVKNTKERGEGKSPAKRFMAGQTELAVALQEVERPARLPRKTKAEKEALEMKKRAREEDADDWDTEMLPIQRKKIAVRTLTMDMKQQLSLIYALHLLLSLAHSNLLTWARRSAS